MRTKGVILTIAIGTLLSCQSNSDKIEVAVFKAPHIINTQFNDSIESTPYQAKSITEVFPSFIGKFKFQEEIDINPEIRDTTIYKDYIEYSRRGLKDSLDVNGLELVVDYDNTVKYNWFYQYGDSSLYDHYPVYFVNSTNTDKVFYGKDSHVFGIQEAVDKEDSGEWRPIEGKGYDFCGYGTWALIVHPQEFVLVLMNKYQGDYETNLRARFQVGENILVSRPFKGMINKSQFSIQDSSQLQRQLEWSEGRAATYLFYGAIPKEEE